MLIYVDSEVGCGATADYIITAWRYIHHAVSCLPGSCSNAIGYERVYCVARAEPFSARHSRLLSTSGRGDADLNTPSATLHVTFSRQR